MNRVNKLESGLFEKLFQKSYFGFLWFGLVAVVLVFVSWPIRNIALVCWVYGSDAYFKHGIRVVSGKPTKFSNGEIAPNFPDFVTGFAALLITFGVMIAVFHICLRIYLRYLKKGVSQ